MKDVITVDKLLEITRYNLKTSPDEIFDKGVIANAKLQFHSLLISKLPEKVKLATSVYQNEGDGNASERIGYKHGFNDSIDDVKAVLAEMFGVGDE